MDGIRFNSKQGTKTNSYMGWTRYEGTLGTSECVYNNFIPLIITARKSKYSKINTACLQFKCKPILGSNN